MFVEVELCALLHRLVEAADLCLDFLGRIEDRLLLVHNQVDLGPCVLQFLQQARV
jgi:hypothetical protein